MKQIFGLFVLAFLITACTGIQLEEFTYTTPEGQTAQCLKHPSMEGYLTCSYIEDGQRVVFAIKQDLVSKEKE